MKTSLLLSAIVLLFLSCGRTDTDLSKQRQRNVDVPLKIACLGASNTAGYQIPDVVNNSWPGQLQKTAGSGWKVLNCGCGGATIMKSGNLPYNISLAYKEAKDFAPDVVIFDFGWNDLKDMNRNKMEDNFVKDYNTLIKEFANSPRKPRLYIILPPLFESPNNGKAEAYAVLEKYYRQIIDQNEITPIDLHASMATIREYYNNDLAHYSVTGCALAAKEVFAVLKKDFP